MLPDNRERAQQELTLQLALGPVLMVTKSMGAVEVESLYTRARELCQQMGETPQLFPALWSLRRFYVLRAELKTAQELEEQLMHLAQGVQDPSLLLESHWVRGTTSFWLGQMAFARECFAQSIALYDPQRHHSHAFLYGSDPGVTCRSYNAFTLWHLGYPGQALQESQRSLALAQELSHPFSLVYALSCSA
jgi:predicted ATPase